MRCCGDLQTPQNGLVTTNLQVLQWADFNKDGNPDLEKEIVIVKQRRGERNAFVPVWFHGHHMRFLPRERVTVRD